MALRRFLILRKLRSSCLEGRTTLIQAIVDFLTPTKAGIYFCGWAPAGACPRAGRRPDPWASVAEAKAGIGAWLGFYNEERQHQSLGYHTPRQIYQEGLWICGRSALPTGSASPASRAGSESGEMLAFAHIPAGTTLIKGVLKVK